MKLYLHQSRHADRRGSALMMVAMVMAISAIILAGAMQWASSNSRMNTRNNDYYRAVASAEAATEKVVAMMSRDFRERDWAYVDSRLPVYRSSAPNSSEHPVWGGVSFTDPSGSTNSIYVTRTSTEQFIELDSQYVGLRGSAATYSVVANAEQPSAAGAPINIGVRQQFQLATIPVFQFAIFYGILMEIHPGPEFHVTGRVHSNDALYYSSRDSLHFHSHVTSVGNMVHGYAPFDSRTNPPSGSVTFYGEADEKTAHLFLPVGTNNSPAAVREILNPPPDTENPNSAMGRQRYFNKADLIITVSNSVVLATSGRENSFATVLSTNDWQKFVTLTNSFRDWREEKLVRPVDINVARLKEWSETNNTLRTTLGNRDVSSIYVNDKRTLPTDNLAAVRVGNGKVLPSRGLTVATARPLYVQGHYNQPIDAHLNTATTSGTLPASFAADAINVLSGNWQDALSHSSLLYTRVASDTTVNAAFLAGIVPSKDSNRSGSDKYSGGVENYPRFLEKWSGKTLTYNGSMVVLFDSQYATNGWKYGGSIYEAPERQWAFDVNFMEPTKLPPGTPRLSATIRGSWAVVPAGHTNTIAETTIVTIGP